MIFAINPLVVTGPNEQIFNELFNLVFTFGFYSFVVAMIFMLLHRS
jgi:hypothetical protein